MDLVRVVIAQWGAWLELVASELERLDLGRSVQEEGA